MKEVKRNKRTQQRSNVLSFEVKGSLCKESKVEFVNAIASLLEDMAA